MFVDLKQKISKEEFPFYLRNTKNPLNNKYHMRKLDNHNIWITRVRVSVVQLYVVCIHVYTVQYRGVK